MAVFDNAAVRLMPYTGIRHFKPIFVLQQFKFTDLEKKNENNVSKHLCC